MALTCEACTEAQHNPQTGLYVAHCDQCKARSIASGPSFHQASRTGRMTAEYKRLMTLAYGDRWQEAHEWVKAWAVKKGTA